jgi:hypothetical protein
VQIGKTPEQPYSLIYSRAEFAAVARRCGGQCLRHEGAPECPAGGYTEDPILSRFFSIALLQFNPFSD